MTTKKPNSSTDDDDFENGLFDWLAQTYQSNQSPSATVDLTQYEVKLSLHKEPNGQDTLSFEVRKKS